VHTPLQQSEFAPQESPSCWQNEGVVQMPLAGQNLEQHCEACVQGFPTVLPHEDGRAVHMPFDPHVPLQHCTLVVQAWPSGVHAGKMQLPLVLHDPLQQSLGLEQAPPSFRHEPPASG